MQMADESNTGGLLEKFCIAFVCFSF